MGGSSQPARRPRDAAQRLAAARHPSRPACARWRLLPLLLALGVRCAAAGGVTSGRTPAGEPICRDGTWTEVTTAQLDSGEVEPQVQCWRTTPCVQSHYMTMEKCAALKEDSDFPATDPLLPAAPGAATMADVARGPLANKTLLFVGDSIMGQTYDAARCDVVRRGLALHEVRDGTTPEALAALGVDAATAARLFAYHAAVKHGFGKGYPCTGEPRAAGDLDACTWYPDPPLTPWVVPETGTIIAFKGWHKFKPVDAAGYLAMVDAVVVNYALHYHNHTEYAEDMEGLMHLLGTHGARRGKAALFRETTAQHFAGTGSFKSIDQAHLELGSRCSCGPMSAETAADNDVTRLNGIAAAAAAKHRAVRLLRLYDLTLPRHDLHEESFCDYVAEASRRRNKEPPRAHGCCDCTHFCYTPVRAVRSALCACALLGSGTILTCAVFAAPPRFLLAAILGGAVGSAGHGAEHDARHAAARGQHGVTSECFAPPNASPPRSAREDLRIAPLIRP